MNPPSPLHRRSACSSFLYFSSQPVAPVSSPTLASARVQRMIRTARGVSPASGRQGAGLSCPQPKVKLLSSGAKSDLLGGLCSPLVNAVPAGYFTQICNTTAAEQRAHSLYSTPHGPEAKPVRASSGRLPVKTHTH